MAADEVVHAVHKATGLIERVPRGYVEVAFPHLYRVATKKDLEVARAPAEAALYPKAAPADKPAEEGK